MDGIDAAGQSVIKATLEIITVNWNSSQLVSEMLTSLESMQTVSFQLQSVTIVDNASEDADRVRLTSISTSSLLPVKIQFNPVNKGFGRACNQAALCSRSDYLLFLNPDTKVFPNSIENAMRFLIQEKSNYAACGVQMLSENKEVMRSCARQPSGSDLFISTLGLDRFKIFPSFIMREWEHKQNQDVEHIIGAFYLIERSVFTKLKGFDETFFVYLEDLDLSRRILALGLKIRFLADTSIIHIGGGSSKQALGPRIAYSIKSRILFAKKHFSAINYLSILIAAIFLEPILRLANAALAPQARVSLRATRKAYFKLLCDFFKKGTS